jgi:thymidylate synthase (FAD)
MRLIKPKVEIIDQNNLLEHMELCGRVSYKSEEKIGQDSAKTFTNKRLQEGHTAVFEHGTVYLIFKWYQIIKILLFWSNKYSKMNHWGYITTNYRVLVEGNMLYMMNYSVPEPTSKHEKRITVKFTCDRGISHELVRHRVFSFLQESTRYCNYSKDKFGGEVTFIIPLFTDFDEGIFHDEINLSLSNSNEDYWFNHMLWSEKTYLHLIKGSVWTPQEGRSVLPNSLKTEVIMTGFLSDYIGGTKTTWMGKVKYGFFPLRDSRKAHPQMQELARALYKMFETRDWV